jgi:hypothetical protein
VRDSEQEDLIIRHNFTVKMKRILEKSGVPHSAFLRSNASLNIDESVAKIECELHGTKLRKVSTSRQVTNFLKLWENPLRGSPLFVISSYPTDIRAKQVALAIMSKGMTQFYNKKQDNKVLIKRAPPVWHNVMGGFKDKYLDSESSVLPSMMILTNVTEDATQVKLEKLRDLIVKFDSIPRVVVTCAADPLTFMLGKLRHHCDGSLYLSPDDRTVSM